MGGQIDHLMHNNCYSEALKNSISTMKIYSQVALNYNEKAVKYAGGRTDESYWSAE